MLNFFQMCDLLDKNRLSEADETKKLSGMDKLKALAAQVKSTQQNSTSPQKDLGNVSPQMVNVEPTSMPATSVDGVDTGSEEGKRKRLDFSDLKKRQDAYHDSRALRTLHGEAGDRTSQHKEEVVGWNDFLAGSLYQFFTKAAIAALRIPKTVISYQDGRPKEVSRMPPVQVPFMISLNKSHGGSKEVPEKFRNRDFEIVMTPRDFNKMTSYVEKRFGHYLKPDAIERVKSFEDALVEKAVQDSSFEAVAIRALKFALLLPKISQPMGTIEEIADQLAELAGRDRGGLGENISTNDVDVLKYMINIDKKGNYGHFTIDDKGRIIVNKVSDESQLGADEQGAGRYDRTADLARKINRSQNLFKMPYQAPRQEEATKLDDLMSLLEYWDF